MHCQCDVRSKPSSYLYSVFEEQLHHLGVLVDYGDGERTAAQRIDAVEIELRPRCRARLGLLKALDDLWWNAMLKVFLTSAGINEEQEKDSRRINLLDEYG